MLYFVQQLYTNVCISTEFLVRFSMLIADVLLHCCSFMTMSINVIVDEGFVGLSYGAPKML